MRQLPRVAAVLGAAVAIVASAESQTANAVPAPTSGYSVSVSAPSSVQPSGANNGQDSMPGMEGTSMPGMGHDSMPGMDHGSSGSGDAASSGTVTHEHAEAPSVSAPTAERPRALVLGGFAAINGAALITAFILRRRKASTPSRRPRTAAAVAAR